MRPASCVILVTLILCAPLPAAPTTAPTPAPSSAARSAAITAPSAYLVTRADVARAYLDLDRLYIQAQLSDAQRARVNQRFDEATILFFRKQHSESIRIIHELIASLAPELIRSPEARLAQSLRVRVAPWVAQSKHPSPLRIMISPMYPTNLASGVTLRLVIRRDSESSATRPAKPIFEREIELDAHGMTPAIAAIQPEAPVGAYRVELLAPDGTAHLAGRWFVAEQPADFQRRSNNLHLNAIKQDSQQILLATAAVAARNNLLVDQYSETESARFASDPIQLMSEVAHEISELESDRDPFVGRAGDYWRTIIIGSLQVPTRIYAPPSTAARGQPMPLVIALHGAGGEEAMFMDGYGNGRIKRLADEKGFIVVAPSTYFAMTAPDAVEGFVHALSYDYLIDRKRVYVIGHSLGAMTAQSYATRWPDRVAAACMIAGGMPFPNQKRMSPTLLIAADVDPILASVGMDVKKVADDARRAGLPVEFRVMKNEGHTLIVGDALPEAIDWLLKHDLKQ